jgi:hypothetical protein
MTRQEYKKARKLIRGNGRMALQWLPKTVRDEAETWMFNITDSKDDLEERASMVNYCKERNIECTAYNTASRAVLKRFEERAKEVRVYNLATDIEYRFDKHTAPKWALAFSYCSEHNMMSALFAAAQDLKLPEFYKKNLKFEYGKVSIGCGDWAVKMPTSSATRHTGQLIGSRNWLGQPLKNTFADYAKVCEKASAKVHSALDRKQSIALNAESPGPRG